MMVFGMEWSMSFIGKINMGESTGVHIAVNAQKGCRQLERLFRTRISNQLLNQA